MLVKQSSPVDSIVYGLIVVFNVTWSLDENSKEVPSIAIVSIRIIISSLAFYFQRGAVETLTGSNLSDDGKFVTCAWREIVVVQAIDGYSLNEGGSLLRNESHVIVLFYAIYR